MSPPDQAEPESHDTDSLDHLVVERVRREIRGSGRELSISARLLRAIRNALYRAPLETEESAAHEALRDSPEKDPVSALISMRVETALNSALDEASKEFGGDDVKSSPSVVVLRRTAGQVDAQVNSALSEVKARVGNTPRPIERGSSSRRIDSSRLLLLAHSAAFEKLRRRLPGMMGEDQKRIVFIARRKGPGAAQAAQVAPATASDIEIVQADTELEPLEQHLTALLAKQRASPRKGGDESMSFPSGATQSPEKREADTAPDPLIGTLFHHKYRIVRKIGHGGFGSVYEARDERGAGNRVAIKVLRTDLAGNRALFQSFKNEARRVTRLSHPNIVDWKVFDETENGTQYLVMELVDGEELDRVLSREGTLPPARVANILLQILDALRAAHNLAEGGSILHLDLKPRNVFLVQGKRDKADLVKVIDFGIGQYIGGEEEEELPDLEADTPARASPGDTSFNPTTMSFHRKREAEKQSAEASADTKGTRFKRSRACTPEYASPEQCVHVLDMPEMVELDGRSDIYSLGVMGFQMLTGHLPFQRPLMRSDMLRLHMQKAPRKVGAMGVRVPRGLAKFIDRCLEKDREKRFLDANAAWRVLHRVVQPPVSHTVAKVVVPLVVIALVTIVSLWSRVGARSALAALSAPELGLDLARDALYLGPSRPSAVVAASTAEGRAALGAGATCRLLQADHTPLEGWSATSDGAGRVTLAPSATPSALLDRHVVIVVDDAEVEFQPFHLMWLSEDAWSVRSIRVGSALLYDTSASAAPDARAIDPSNQNLELKIGGPAADALDSVRVRFGGSEPRLLSLAEKNAQGDLLYRTSLADQGMVRGENEIAVAVTDQAGRTWERKVPLRVIADRLPQPQVRLLDRAGSIESECNQVLGRYSIYPQTRPKLRVVFDRPADVTWSIQLDEKNEVLPGGKSVGLEVHEIELDATEPFAGTRPFAGSIKIKADDGAYVVHAEADRGRAEHELLFVRSVDAASIEVRYEDAGLGHKLAEGQPISVNRRDVQLIVTRKSNARVKVTVSARLEGASDAPASVESSLLKSEYEAPIPLHFARDGHYTVTVNAYQYLTQADVVGDRPDVTQQYTLVVDTIAPRLDVRGLKAGQLLLPKDGRAAQLEIALPAGDEKIAGSPVDVTWELLAGQGGRRLESGEVGHELTEPAQHSFDLPDLWSAGPHLPDGDHVLVVQARDLAGNDSEPVRVEFSIASTGPRLELDAPQDFGVWKQTANGDWLVEVRASDPNGVDRVTCDVLQTGATGGPLSVLLTTSATDPVQEQLWTGRLRFPESWSRNDARLRLSAVDRAGVSSAEEKGPFRLPEIEAARPEVVSVARPDRAAERMRLVTGNAGFIYYFGGQGDEIENRLFVQAGLDRFNDKLGQTGRQISWAIAYAAGEIEDFYLDEHEVTCGQFLEFLNAKDQGYADRSHWPAGSAPLDRARMSELATRLASASRELPVTDVTWEEASAYAHWVGKRLPSWVEWEYAARGGQSYRPYAAFAATPKKPEINVSRVDGTREPWARGAGSDVTPDTSLANLTGNVAEWTASPDLTQGKEGVDVARHAAENARLLLRPGEVASSAQSTHFWAVGGSYARNLLNFFTYDSRLRDSRRASLGFRCAASLSDVRAKLADGRFGALETAGTTPK